MKDGTLILGFTTEILKSKMEAPDNLDATREAIMSVLNVDMPIKCILVSGKANTATPEMDVEADGIVGTALNLGGKLVHRE